MGNIKTCLAIYYIKNRLLLILPILGDIEDPEKIMRIRKSLIEYCRLDTLAMFKILEKLKLV